MNHIFSGNFSVPIMEMLAQKRALGYDYKTEERVLVNFDQYSVENYPLENNLTYKLVTAWATIRPTEHIRSFQSRLTPIRELGRYMLRAGWDAYILPTDYAGFQRKEYIPHIYTKNELTDIFRAADQMPYSKRYPTRHLVISVVLRVIYCCGLRPAEPLKLKNCDVDLNMGQLLIRGSKGHKDRAVMLADDLLMLCRKYHEKMLYIFPDSEYFFPNQTGGQYSMRFFDETFLRIKKAAGIQRTNERNARIYDLRHTFVTDRIYAWMIDGKDLHALLPYLSAYLGHSSYAQTAYYFHLVPEYFTQNGLNIDSYSGAIPEVAL